MQGDQSEVGINIVIRQRFNKNFNPAQFNHPTNNVVNDIGIRCVIERFPVISDPRFKRLHKCLRPIINLERGKIGLRNGNNRRPCNIFSILEYQIRTKVFPDLIIRSNPTAKAL